MKIIAKMSKMIDKKLHCAKHYAEDAAMFKAQDADAAELIYRLSLEESSQVKLLHDAVTKLIERHRREHGEPPTEMMAVYEYEHKRQMEHSADVKRLQEAYKDL